MPYSPTIALACNKVLPNVILIIQNDKNVLVAVDSVLCTLVDLPLVGESCD